MAEHMMEREKKITQKKKQNFDTKFNTVGHELSSKANDTSRCYAELFLSSNHIAKTNTRMAKLIILCFLNKTKEIESSQGD